MKIICFVLVVVTLTGKLHSQNQPPLDLVFYGAFIHQHHEFYHRAFSYQGIETGTMLNHTFLLGAYASTFASILQVTIENRPAYLQLWQAGLMGGIVTNDMDLLHEGFLVNVGYISIVADHSSYPLFKEKNTAISIGGLVLVPQAFAELNITEWMRARLGIGFDIYGFHNQSSIKRSDLQNISFNFGFLFGKFKKNK